MYGKTARTAMRKIVDESVDLVRGTDGKTLKPGARNTLVDRIFFELWMRGFAVSARTPGLKAGFRRDDHDAWRNRKLGRPSTYNQSDVEVQAKISPEGVEGYSGTPGP